MKIFNTTKRIKEERPTAETIIYVIRKRKVKGEETTEHAYFISDLDTTHTAKLFWDLVRWHWWVENSLHYVKDVSQWEDDSKIRTNNQPHNISTLRSIALNILRQIWYTNIAQWMRLISHDIKRMTWSILA